jgi:hypothetical protein
MAPGASKESTPDRVVPEDGLQGVDFAIPIYLLIYTLLLMDKAPEVVVVMKLENQPGVEVTEESGLVVSVVVFLVLFTVMT